jgi:hypothetical protein
MGRLGAALRSDYEHLLRHPVPEKQRELLAEYAAADAERNPEASRRQRRSGGSETVPHLPS